MLVDLKKHFIDAINSAFNMNITDKDIDIRFKKNKDKYLYTKIAHIVKDKYHINVNKYDIADNIKSYLQLPEKYVSKVQVEENGYITIIFTNEYYVESIKEIVNAINGTNELSTSYNIRDINNNNKSITNICIDYPSICDRESVLNYIMYRCALYGKSISRLLFRNGATVTTSMLVQDITGSVFIDTFSSLIVKEYKKIYSSKFDTNCQEDLKKLQYLINKTDNDDLIIIDILQSNIIRYINKEYGASICRLKDELIVKETKAFILNYVLSTFCKLISENINNLDRESEYLSNNSNLIRNFMRYIEDNNLIIIDENGSKFLNTKSVEDFTNRLLVTDNTTYTKLAFEYAKLFKLFKYNKFDKIIFIRSTNEYWHKDMILTFMKLLNITNVEVEFKFIRDIYNNEKKYNYKSIKNRYTKNYIDIKIDIIYNMLIKSINRNIYLNTKNTAIDNLTTIKRTLRDAASYHNSYTYSYYYRHVYEYESKIFDNKLMRDIVNQLEEFPNILNRTTDTLKVNYLFNYIDLLIYTINKYIKINISDDFVNKVDNESFKSIMNIIYTAYNLIISVFRAFEFEIDNYIS